MGVYIDMEMPKDRPQLLWIYPNGKVLTVQSDVDPWKELQAVHVPPHGRLIDADDLCHRIDAGKRTISSLPLPDDFIALYEQIGDGMKDELYKSHTIIPASKED